MLWLSTKAICISTQADVKKQEIICLSPLFPHRKSGIMTKDLFI